MSWATISTEESPGQHIVAFAKFVCSSKVRFMLLDAHLLQAATIDEARTTITAYAERFTSSMLSALATSEQGALDNNVALLAAAHTCTVVSACSRCHNEVKSQHWYWRPCKLSSDGMPRQLHLLEGCNFH